MLLLLLLLMLLLLLLLFLLDHHDTFSMDQKTVVPRRGFCAAAGVMQSGSAPCNATR
jgi:hypothetical protein